MAPWRTSDYSRKFLVLIDDSPECDRAVSFAAHRVKRTGGTLVLMSVIDSADFDQFIGVADTMRAEARDEAERSSTPASPASPRSARSAPKP